MKKLFNEIKVNKSELNLIIERVNNSAILTQYDLLRAEYEENIKIKESLVKDYKKKVKLIQILNFYKSKNNIVLKLQLEQLQIINQSLSKYFDCSEKLENELKKEAKTYYNDTLIEKLNNISKFNLKNLNSSKSIPNIRKKIFNCIA